MAPQGVRSTSTKQQLFRVRLRVSSPIAFFPQSANNAARLPALEAWCLVRAWNHNSIVARWQADDQMLMAIDSHKKSILTVDSWALRRVSAMISNGVGVCSGTVLRARDAPEVRQQKSTRGSSKG